MLTVFKGDFCYSMFAIKKFFVFEKLSRIKEHYEKCYLGGSGRAGAPQVVERNGR